MLHPNAESAPPNYKVSRALRKKISHTKMKDYNHVGDLLKVKNIGTFLRGKLKKKIY